ncbi:FtsX-like permease family protein [Erysipelothrix rhusiopathiae]|uniref:FtsX-like permease family protein n=1 Tax=Erysipelothrix rhusiopathiae TaxID=1648 RepID=UPI001EDE2652|nr:FtsX-like permease family protein [Erysipelothrix rhusiopathiae]MCG4437048.1 FtsX-like permease family protein [Erysipelothrix rhusiopathiae]MDE8064546.1 FtsX-like permease family protein [Erysipelothrix rhusiopathiae]MDE8080003.1 FtsX-like permease family protein [Erysipelothrix rhusiopathiae]MDE8084849.1 FtsX-like permease family protein [Erysipelothrix rhusiopathiae]MDE8088399.1 FtsX-like permease family protein [Erysipelothrix rhusiopathiae]
MYSKLALRNVKKSYRDFFIYFITLTFSVSLFYVFSSFGAQASIMNLSTSQGSMVEALIRIMNAMSYIVAVVFAFLILYANHFLIKRRHQELGVYTLLGMPKRYISRILIYETLYIGVFSLGSGLLLGLALSQITTLLSAKVLSVSTQYHFVFSMSATLKTIVCFMIIFMVVMIFNGVILNKYKLIDLLRSKRQNETLKVRKTWVSVVVFILACVLIGFAYKLALKPLELIRLLPLVLVTGALGTFMLFLSFSGFMLKFMQINQKRYNTGLNSFVFRQVSAKISSTYKMMAVITLMLLIAIGALATAFNLNYVLGNEVEKATGYDVSVVVAGSEGNDYSSLFEDVAGIKNHIAASIYDLGIEAKDMGMTHELYGNQRILFMTQSDFNALRMHEGLEPIQLSNQDVFFQKAPTAGLQIDDLLKLDHINILDTSFKLQENRDGKSVRIANGSMIHGALFVVNDSHLPSLQSKMISNDAWNQNTFVYNIGVEGTQEDVVATINQKLDGQSLGLYHSIISSNEVIESMNGTELLFTYVGLYLGLVFLLSSVVVLALQQLSEASDNQARYRVLSKLGADSKLIKNSILKQISIYFFLPLIIALIHAYVGIKAMNVNLNLAGLAPDTMMPALLTTIAIIVMYLIYFIITYSSSKAIILED